jgi:DNA-binding YbaB/EbfC family protein
LIGAVLPAQSFEGDIMFGDLGKIMKMAGQMKSKMPEIQQKLADAQFTAQSGGAVTATVNGKMELVDVKIDRDAIGDLAGDLEMLEDLIRTAVSAAQAKAAHAATEAMKELTGGIDIPGLTL